MPDSLFFAEMPDVSLRSWNMGALSIFIPLMASSAEHCLSVCATLVSVVEHKHVT